MQTYTLVGKYENGEVAIDWIDAESAKDAIEGQFREREDGEATWSEVVACFEGTHEDLMYEVASHPYSVVLSDFLDVS